MIKVSINREISRYYGISEREISEQLKAAATDEEIEILINSPGGEIYEGLAVFNLIREYAKSHAVIVRINGLAASVASYIAVAARTVNKDSKISVSENSIFLIHNPWNIVSGDYRKLKKTADYLEKLAAMCGSTYAYVSGKNEKEIRAMMDVETYLVGNEIIENGFANEFEEINPAENEPLESDKNSLIINAKLKIEKALEKMKEISEADLEKAVALVVNPLFRAEAPGMTNKGFETTPGGNAGGVSLQNQITEKPGETLPAGSEGGKMNKEELKAKYPELYAAIFTEGKEAGLKEERDRAEAHLKLGEESGSMKTAAQFIREGKAVFDNKVQAEYLAAQMKNSALLARNQDNPDPLNPAGGKEADDAAMEEAWNLGQQGKDLQGVK
jgi:ATP-dependent protease ClpP protease subunit